MKNILITGGNGFIGKNLTQYLLENTEAKIYLLDNYFSSNYYTSFNNEPRTISVHKDVRLSLAHIFHNTDIDIIYHLACPASPLAYQREPLFTHETNIYGMVNVLKLAWEKNAKVVFASTSEVYGDPQVDIQNEVYRGNVNTLGPRACYDEGKRMAETICYDYHNRLNVDVRIARIFNSYGPFMDKNDGRIISNFVNQALADEPITVYGTGEQTRSLCYVSDTVKGLVALAETDTSNAAVPVNIGNSNELTVLEIAEKIKELTASQSVIEFHELPVDDPRKRNPCILRAKNLLNWEPEVSLEDGLKKTIKYFRG